MNQFLMQRAMEIDAQLKAARTTEEKRALISARKLIRGAMERMQARDAAATK
jgi:hypothetical protein